PDFSVPHSSSCHLRSPLRLIYVRLRALDRLLRDRRRRLVQLSLPGERQPTGDRGISDGDDQRRDPPLGRGRDQEDERGGEYGERGEAEQAGPPEGAGSDTEPLRLQAHLRFCQLDLPAGEV